MPEGADPLQYTTSGGSNAATAPPAANTSMPEDDPLRYVTNRSRSGMPAPYPDMTPGPPTKVLDTSFHTVPSDTRSGMPWEDYQPPTFSGTASAVEGAFERAGTAMGQTYQDTPPVVGPTLRSWIGPVASDVIDAIGKGTAAAGAGLSANISEALSGGDPQKARDATILQQVLPVVAATSPKFAGPIVADEPSYTGPLKTADVTPPPGAATTPPGPVGPLYQPPTLPTQTPADVLKVYQGQRAAADAGNFQLKPQFTDNFVSSLDKYQPQSATAQATAPTANPVSTLIDNLKKSASAPFTDMRSIQEVDKQIQDAISGQYGSNGLSPEGVQMRQILRDFRDQYENVPPDQVTGSTQAVSDFANARNTYAAYSRMKELQGVVDSTEGNPNRATLIASRVNGFLNDPANTRGWNPDEIASARQAANSGFMQEWMRAEGSRLVGIGAAVALPGVGKLLGVPAQVGLSYAVRNAAETARLAQVAKAMGYLGQRVDQPGTVPTPPAPVMPPRSMLAARYAPLTGLLGSTQDQDRQGTILP